MISTNVRSGTGGDRTGLRTGPGRAGSCVYPVIAHTTPSVTHDRLRVRAAEANWSAYIAHRTPPLI